MVNSDLPKKRLITYVDGFNLYFGLRESGWRRYYWLDIQRLAVNLLPADNELVGVKYFTAHVVAPPDKRKRQSDFLEALQTLPQCQMIFGKYQFAKRFCQNCSYEERVPNEKMTDVNIAVEMMADAFQDRFDTAMLISGDSDLTPPVAAIRRLFPEKRVIVAFPPRRSSNELAGAASSHFVIARTKFRDSQMPLEVVKADGYILKKPENWR